MRKGTRTLLAILLLAVTGSVFGQASLSPYSTLGIGDPFQPTMIHNEGMAGLGLARGYTYWLNTMNPALLPYNEFSVFGIGMFGDYRSYQQGGESGTSGGANLKYLAIAFPLKDRKWTMMVDLSPYSSVNYNFGFTEDVSGTPPNSTEVVFGRNGQGGLNRLSLSSGYNVFKGFNVGLKASYMFGVIKREYQNILSSTIDPAVYIPVVFERDNISDVALGTGLSYKIPIGETDLELGFIYDLDMNLNATALRRIELRTPNGNTVQADTTVDGITGNVFIPSKLGGGFSFSKSLKWTVGMDVYFQDWSRFRNFGGTNPNFSSTNKVILGGEFIPNILNPNTYLDRITYRLGLSYESSPYTFDSGQINEFGVNVGWSLPVGRVSVLDFAVRYGQRGTTDNNLISEQYFRFFFGATFNDKWFQRRKYN